MSPNQARRTTARRPACGSQGTVPRQRRGGHLARGHHQSRRGLQGAVLPLLPLQGRPAARAAGPVLRRARRADPRHHRGSRGLARPSSTPASRRSSTVTGSATTSMRSCSTTAATCPPATGSLTHSPCRPSATSSPAARRPARSASRIQRRRPSCAGRARTASTRKAFSASRPRPVPGWSARHSRCSAVPLASPPTRRTESPTRSLPRGWGACCRGAAGRFTVSRSALPLQLATENGRPAPGRK